MSLTKVKKKDHSWKEAIIRKTQQLCSEYDSIYVFTHQNLRNDVFQSLREVRSPATLLPANCAQHAITCMRSFRLKCEHVQHFCM